MGIVKRPSNERGSADLGWLKAKYSFSFAEYHDPQHKGFRSLRVINEDRIVPGQGFDTHPHHDMEILTYVIDGELQHRDSMGNGSVIRSGDFQRMSAGSGVEHSEFNPSKTKPTHLLQIWILPDSKKLAPSYEQLPSIQLEEKLQGLRLAADSKGEGCLLIHQDVKIYLGQFDQGHAINYEVETTRGIWIQMIHGRLNVDCQEFSEGDGACIEGVPQVSLEAKESCLFLLFDIA